MPTDSQYERDFENVAGKRFPARYDPREFQNIPNAGDGNPGLQAQIRNWVKYYLHQGFMELALAMNGKNIDLANNVDINGILDVLGVTDLHDTLDMNNQDIEKVKDLDVDGILDVFGDVDLHSDLDIHNGNIDDVKSIDGGGDAVQFDDDINLPSNNITLGAAQTVDGVDVSAIALDNMPTAPIGDIPVNTQKITSLANGAAATDAMALGQKYTDANARTSINDIFGADGKADSDIDLDDNDLDNIETAKLTEQPSDPSGEANKLIFFAKDGELYYKTLYQTYKIDHVKGWDISTAVYLQKFDVSAREATPKGLFFRADGLKMYVIGQQSDDVEEYDLSIAWDISSAVWLQDFDVSPKEPNSEEVFFRADGLKMYITGDTDHVHEYDLSIAWDISSAVWLQQFDTLVGNDTRGLFFRADGLKMYTTEVNITRAVSEFDLSIAWDVTSAVFLQDFDTSAKETTPTGVFFKPDGFKMYVAGSSGNDVNEYDLSPAWDISSAVWLQDFAPGSGPEDVFFRADGLKMYVMGKDDDVYEYDLTPM